MAVSTAPRTGVTRWSAEADPFNRTQTDADHALLDDLVAIDLHDGTLAARPAVGIRGRYFTESAASAGLPGATWREDGTAWRSLGSRVLSTGTTDVAKVVAGVTGQTANLQEWRAGASTLGHIDSGGQLFAVGAQLGLAPQTALAAMLGVTPTSAAAVAAIIRGAVSQSADLQQWQSNAGTVLARVDSTGAGTFAGVTTAGTVTGRLARWSSAAVGDIPMQINGFAGQTGDLTQWRDSGGTVLAKLGSTGLLGANFGYFGPTPGSASVGGVLNAFAATTSSIPLIAKGVAAQSGDLQQWQDSTGAVLSKVTASGGGQFTGAVVNLTTGSQLGSSTNLMLPGSASQSALVAKGLASQSGSLQQWQDSTGAVLASISAAGQLSAPVVSVAGGPTTGASIFGQVPAGQGAGVAFLLVRDSGGADLFRVMPNGQVFSQVNAAAAVASITKGAASQSGDLAQWQNSAGTPLSSMSAAGQLWASGGGMFIPIGAAIPTGSNGFAPQVAVIASSSVTPPILARGAASQTGNLQEWQNSAGTVNASIAPDGSVFSRGYVQASAYSLHGNASRYGASSTAIVSVNTGAAGNEGVIVRGIASQSADLQQWQSSAGTILSKIGSGGGLVTGGGGVPRTSVDNTMYASAAGTIPLAILGAASASAALTRWSVVNDTTVAAVTQTGNVQGTGAYTTLSDAAAKRNVRSLPHDSALAVIRRLRPQLFDYIDGERDQVGFVAQEVAQHLPHAVVPFSSTGRPYDYDRLGVRSEAIVAYLVAAVQELAAAA